MDTHTHTHTHSLSLSLSLALALSLSRFLAFSPTHSLAHAHARYLQEYTELGTAGGLYHYRDLLLRGKPDVILLMHGNICGDFPLQGQLLLSNTVSVDLACLRICLRDACACVSVCVCALCLCMRASSRDAHVP